MKKIEDHEIAGIFPLIEGPEFQELVASIRKNGLREKITLLDDQILDGRNRYRAAVEAGTFDRAKHTQLFAFSDRHTARSEAIEYVLDKNMFRRQLTKDQRKMAAAKSVKMYEAEAAARQKAGLRGVESNPTEKGRSAEKAAAKADVSVSGVKDAKKVLDSDPALADQVQAGKVPLAAAVKQVAANQTQPATDPTTDAQPDLDEAINRLRLQHKEFAVAVYGETFANAFQAGEILKTAPEAKAFFALPPSTQGKKVVPFLFRGYTVKGALNLAERPIDGKMTLGELFLLTECHYAQYGIDPKTADGDTRIVSFDTVTWTVSVEPRS